MKSQKTSPEKAMTPEQVVAYYEKFDKSRGEIPYLADLQEGKIRIYDVPRKYRNTEAYVYANEHTKADNFPIIERRLLGHQILDDIITAHKKGERAFEMELRDMYYDLLVDLDRHNS